MNGDRKRQIALLAIVIILLVLAIYRLGGQGAAADDPDRIGGGQPEAVLASLQEVPEVPWDRLEEEAVEYNPKGRNLFKFGQVKPPPPSPEELEAMRLAREAEEKARREREEMLRKRQEEQQARLQAARDQTPTRPQATRPQDTGPRTPPPPNPTFKFIGYVGPTEDKIAVLLDGEDFHLSRVGEVVNEKFRIVEIGYEWVQIGYTDPAYKDQTRRLLMGQ